MHIIRMILNGGELVAYNGNDVSYLIQSGEIVICQGSDIIACHKLDIVSCLNVSI